MTASDWAADVVASDRSASETVVVVPALARTADLKDAGASADSQMAAAAADLTAAVAMAEEVAAEVLDTGKSLSSSEPMAMAAGWAAAADEPAPEETGRPSARLEGTSAAR